MIEEKYPADPVIAKYMCECRSTPEYEKCVLRSLWHYPSKGEYPDDNEIVLLSIKGRVWKKMEFGQWNGMFFVANDSDYLTKEILAWMAIIPPKEEADART